MTNHQTKKAEKSHIFPSHFPRISERMSFRAEIRKKFVKENDQPILPHDS